MIDMGDVRRRFVQTFFEEAEDNLGVLETGLLDLSRGDGDAEALHRIFRAAHSITRLRTAAGNADQSGTPPVAGRLCPAGTCC